MGCTATKIPFMYSKKRNCAATFMCLYVSKFQDRSTYFPAEEEADRSWEYIITHSTWMWKLGWGRAIPVLGIFVSFFWYCVFAVCFTGILKIILWYLSDPLHCTLGLNIPDPQHWLYISWRNCLLGIDYWAPRGGRWSSVQYANYEYSKNAKFYADFIYV